MVVVEPDENSECGLSGADRQRESWRAAVAITALKSANTLHKHIRSEEFYFVLEGTGRMRVGGETLTAAEIRRRAGLAPNCARRFPTTPIISVVPIVRHWRNWNFCRVRSPKWTCR